jgi:hypothetical protein
MTSRVFFIVHTGGAGEKSPLITFIYRDLPLKRLEEYGATPLRSLRGGGQTLSERRQVMPFTMYWVTKWLKVDG